MKDIKVSFIMSPLIHYAYESSKHFTIISWNLLYDMKLLVYFAKAKYLAFEIQEPFRINFEDII